MRSNLSKSGIYSVILIVSLVFAIISGHSELKHFQVSALLPFNNTPLFASEEHKTFDSSDSCTFSSSL